MTDPAVAQPKTTKTTKPWYMKWWVWLIAAVVILGAIGNLVNPAPKVEIPELTGLPAAEASEQLKELGFKVSMKSPERTVLVGDDYDVESSDPAAGDEAAEGSRVTLNVVEATERLAEEAAEAERIKEEEAEAKEAKRAEETAAREAEAAERAAQPLNEDNARPFCLAYADQMFPYGIKVHYIAGVLAEEETETGWYMKYTADITNEYGAKRKSNIECHMSGTNGSPVMDDFLAY